jgi:hypothetical protein
MPEKFLHQFLSYLIAAVWLINGLFCKVLNLVSRHQQIVAEIIGEAYARPLTLLIGFLEIGIGLWILSGVKTRLNTFVQIVVVVLMNTLEFVLVPDLLLWGRANSIFALLFVFLVYFNEFYLNKKTTP